MNLTMTPLLTSGLGKPDDGMFLFLRFNYHNGSKLCVNRFHDCTGPLRIKQDRLKGQQADQNKCSKRCQFQVKVIAKKVWNRCPGCLIPAVSIFLICWSTWSLNPVAMDWYCSKIRRQSSQWTRWLFINAYRSFGISLSKNRLMSRAVYVLHVFFISIFLWLNGFHGFDEVFSGEMKSWADRSFFDMQGLGNLFIWQTFNGIENKNHPCFFRQCFDGLHYLVFHLFFPEVL